MIAAPPPLSSSSVATLAGVPDAALQPDEIRRLGDLIRANFEFSPDIEAGVEVDPRRLSRDHLVALREAGFGDLVILERASDKIGRASCRERV